jgi:hypothetical protein
MRITLGGERSGNVTADTRLLGDDLGEVLRITGFSPDSITEIPHL